jgi:Putative transposase
VLAYLSRHAPGRHLKPRLIAHNDRGVTFRWKDYREHGRTRHKTMTLQTEEFMRRFLLDVLPSGFHRIRHYGLLANTNRQRDIQAVRELLHQPAPRLGKRKMEAMITAAHGPPSCACTAALQCSSSRPSHDRSTSVGRRSHRSRHEHSMLNSTVFPVGTSSNLADANARGNGGADLSFMPASLANIRLRPRRGYTPWRRGHRIGPAIKLAEPSASVQIPIAHRRS